MAAAWKRAACIVLHKCGQEQLKGGGGESVGGMRDKARTGQRSQSNAGDTAVAGADGARGAMDDQGPTLCTRRGTSAATVHSEESLGCRKCREWTMQPL